MKQIVRTRIAPSPTGEDLHIGTVYTALYNYIFAKQNKGNFIVRIEDTDRIRFVTGAEQKMLASLKWVGIKYDEGVDIGGQYSPYRQSERLPIYQKYVRQLIEQKDAYYCFCTPQRLSELRLEQQKQKKPPMYDGLCKKIPLHIAKERIKSEKFVIRLNVPDNDITKFNDVIRGSIQFENKLIDDQVLLKSDGYPTYHLAVVVDDHLMKITHIIRGEEWLSSTPKHILLYQMLKWDLPYYVHLPLLRNPDQSKLSKRKNPVWLSWFKKEGFLPEAILNYLGILTGSMTDETEIFSLKEMLKKFSLKNIKTTAPIFDLQKLTWLNGEYIRKIPEKELISKIIQFEPNFEKDLVNKLMPLARERMKKLSEFKAYTKPFTNYKKINLSDKQINTIKIFLEQLNKLNNWQTANLHNLCQKIVTEKDLKIRDAFMDLRLAVTGEKIGLPLFETMEILGKYEVLERLSAYEN